MGSLGLSVERVCLWATVALHLWGVQVTGLAARWTGYVFRGWQLVQEELGDNVVGGRKEIVVGLSKLCLSPLPLRRARPAPSLQSQSSGSWPSSPWLWHSGTTPAKTIRVRYLLLPLWDLITFVF